MLNIITHQSPLTNDYIIPVVRIFPTIKLTELLSVVMIRVHLIIKGTHILEFIQLLYAFKAYSEAILLNNYTSGYFNLLTKRGA